MPNIRTNEQAWAYARDNGFKYNRCRIGYSIYRHTDGRTLEIGQDCAKLYRAPGTTKGFDKTKTDRLIEICRYRAPSITEIELKEEAKYHD